MSHDIIDNRTRELAPEINSFLADSIRWWRATDEGGYPLIRFPSAAQIDALVYELCGLTEEEIAIVEG